MSGSSQYPKDIQSPNGFKTRVAFNAEEERDIRAEDQRWQAEHTEANAAAMEGREIRKAPAEAKRGPGRPPKADGIITNPGEQLNG